FTDTIDDVTAYVLSANWFLGMAGAYRDWADDSMLTLVLDNSSKRFSPESPKLADQLTDNPLFGLVRPYRPVRIQSNDGTTTRTHWFGWIEKVEPMVNAHGQRQCKITAAGPMLFFTAAETRIALQENQRTDQIIAALLKEVVIPPALNGAWYIGVGGMSEI